MRKLCRWITGKGLVAIALLSVISGGHTQPVSLPDYSQFAPIYELALRLEARYAKPVTVEGPLQLWRGEMERISFNGHGIENLGPKPYSLLLPKGDPVLSAPALSIEIVNQALDVYHRQNPNRSHYRVLESPMGFHIVPTAAHDEAGVMRPVNSLLDTMIEVPSGMRTATEHVQALVDAVSQSTGIPFREVYEFDARYAANGYVIRSRSPRPQDRPYMVFEWGASEVIARSANRSPGRFGNHHDLGPSVLARRRESEPAADLRAATISLSIGRKKDGCVFGSLYEMPSGAEINIGMMLCQRHAV
jgi:hypothetical protein